MKQKIGLVILMVWCLLFLRCETTEKSMVRAVCLSRQAGQWQAGLLYQAPEASADASEASGAVQLAYAEGQTLETALSAAEKLLPQKANYRLCDTVLLPDPVQTTVLAEYEQLVLKRQCGRTASRLVCTNFSLQDFAEMCEETPALTDQLMQKIRQNTARMPYLYEQNEAVLLPILTLQEGELMYAQSALLHTVEKTRPLSREYAEAAWLMKGTGGGSCFWLEGEQILIRRCSVSVTLTSGAVLLRLDCQNGYDTPQPDAAQVQQLETLCTQTVQNLWQGGVDLLHLQQRAMLKDGRAAQMFDPQKNACPQLRTDVQFLPY